MPYINRRAGRTIETVDSAETGREAVRLVREYRLADGAAEYYVSGRSTAEWRAAEREAARPAEVSPAGFLPAYHDGFGGLRPCQILAARSDSSGAISFKVRFTGRGDAPEVYRAGAVHWMAARVIVPRGAMFRRRGAFRVRGYVWAELFPELAELRHTGPGALRHGPAGASDWSRESNASTAEQLAAVTPRAAHARAYVRAVAAERESRA